MNQRHFGGKRDSRRHLPTSFRENVSVEETSYQMREVLSFCYRERAQRSVYITELTFLGNKSKEKLSGVSFFFRTRAETFKLNLAHVLIFVL